MQVRASSYIQMNQPTIAAISQVYYLSFKYSSTCFGHPHAHHQGLNNCCSGLWFTVGHGQADHDQQHCYHHVPTVNQRPLQQLLSS